MASINPETYGDERNWLRERMTHLKILWIPHTGWHIPQRAHLFCYQLAERHEVHATDWIADFVRPSDYFSRRYLRNFTYRQRQDKGVTVHGIPRISPAIMSSSLRRFNQRIFSNYVEKIIDDHKIDVVVGTFVVPPPKAKRVIFDLFDENVTYWKLHGKVSGYADEIAGVEYWYMTTADATVAASTVLRDKAENIAPGRPVYLIPNGIDISRYINADGREFRASLQASGMLVGIVGSHDRRSEIELILSTAALMRDEPVTFLIAGRGSQMNWARQEAARMGLANIRFHGFVPFDNLPSVMNALDVGLCPYAKSEMDDARSPMRLFSYLAAEVPVVCTDLTSVRDLQMENVVLVEDTPEGFAEGIRLALTLTRCRPDNLYRFDIARLATQYEDVLEGKYS